MNQPGLGKIVMGAAAVYIAYQLMKPPTVVYIERPETSGIKRLAKEVPMNIKAFRKGGIFAPDSGHPDEMIYKTSPSGTSINNLYDLYSDKLLGNIHTLNNRHFNTVNTKRQQVVGPGEIKQPVTHFITDWYAPVFEKARATFVTRPLPAQNPSM